MKGGSPFTSEMTPRDYVLFHLLGERTEIFGCKVSEAVFLMKTSLLCHVFYNRGKTDLLYIDKMKTELPPAELVKIQIRNLNVENFIRSR